nr:immunoglobulin light chain junction region [Macaca mulatta]MOW61637.1 immunoglobulin light chain junction region [Macaca mulatta]MOW70737.1 immunoglobulin light chain junction region [Macaca mulatta]
DYYCQVYDSSAWVF